MKIFTLAILFSLCFTSVFAQTKLIAHRSHSGKNAFFSVNADGNFGLVRREVDSAQIKRYDSIRRAKELPITLRNDAAHKLGTIAVARR